MVDHGPSLAARVCRVGSTHGTACDSYGMWTLAGVRCLKHQRQVGPKSRPRALFSEDSAKHTSAKAWSLLSHSAGQEGGGGKLPIFLEA